MPTSHHPDFQAAVEPSAAAGAETGSARPPVRRFLDRRLSDIFPANVENLLAAVLLGLAAITRLYGLGERVFTHDELNTITAAYSLAGSGNMGWSPMMHGPLEMYLTAASFILFGDGDVAARLPFALFGIATVGIALFLFRRYLGRAGALLAGLFFLISPYMLYYARYTRNEALIAVWTLLTLYAVLRYLERGEIKMLVLLTAVYALHSTDKITSLIHAGGLTVFLTGYLLVHFLRRGDIIREAVPKFLVCLSAAAVCLASAAVLLRGSGGPMTVPAAVFILAGLIAGIAGAFLLLRGGNWRKLREERSFDLLILYGTLTLPLVGAVPIRLLGLNPQNAVASNLTVSLLVLLVLAAVSIAIGLLWRPRVWPFLAVLFFAIFSFFFTSAFTNWLGLEDGLFQFLGYWISVQLLEGHLVYQPWFYYLVIQIPIYEFLPAAGTAVAAFLCWRRGLWSSAPGKPFEKPSSPEELPVPFMALMLFWTIFNAVVFSYASEKMPQQTTLTAVPMILAAAWAAGYLLETEAARTVIRPLGWIVGVPSRIASWFGKTLAAAPIMERISSRTIDVPRNAVRSGRTVVLAVLALLAVLTARAAYRASFILQDLPYEYLVYANCAPSTKIVVQEIERLSYLTTGGTDLVVAYDNNVRYPFWWYLRHYPNAIDFDVNPTADIRRASIVVVGDQNNSKVAPILGEDYVSFTGTRMWWHNQDYYRLKWDEISSEYLTEARENGVDDPPPMAVSDYLRLVWNNHVAPILQSPAGRSGAFQIWLNRDFTEWGEYVGHGGYTYQDWSLAERLHIYFRKDILDYLGGAAGDSSSGAPAAYDPYTLSEVDLIPDLTLGQTGDGPLQFLAPRGIAPAPDGSLYVADSLNHRIQHISPEGDLISQWGSFAGLDQGDPPGGTFNEPWGVAVGPDGSVYVADTWNHRVQKFSADGVFLAMWGAPPSDPEAAVSFYGPRAVAVDARNRVFVADTGNKRIMVFSSDGDLLTAFGSPGAGEGQLDEPVGLALDELGRVYVADTWNRRVQIFAPGPNDSFVPVDSWEVNAWFGTTAEIKPYLAVDSSHHVYLSDPSTCRILEFTERGVILAVWGRCGTDELSLDSPTGLAVDPLGGLWVSDSRHDRLVHFPMPPSGGEVLRLE